VHGVRARLTATLVALVVLTALVLGVGSYVVVDVSLHDRLLRAAEEQARFDLTAVVPGRDVEELRAIFLQRATVTVIDTGQARGIVELLRPELRDLPPGRLAYEWIDAAGPKLVVGGVPASGGPTYYFVHDASAIEQTLATLRAALAVGALLLAVLALVAARRIARGVLAPVNAAARAAQRIGRGDLSARIPLASRDELGDLAARFNQMAEALETTIGELEASQAQNRRFVADVSHELRTPLTALVAEASILREHLGALPPDARRTGELLVGDVARLRTLVDELMELSRFDASAEQVAAERVDLVGLVRTITAARAPGVPVVAAPGEIAIQTEPRRLERILGNLLDNAREHAAGARVEVHVRTRGEWAYVEVLDEGPGIPADRIGRVFDRFFKADPSRAGGSSGLGLAIAAEHAALLGGRLRAFNRPEGGLRMALRMPVTEPLPLGDGVANERREAEAPIQSTRELQP
jgi:two-component system sensor histidine kinase MtrB